MPAPGKLLLAALLLVALPVPVSAAFDYPVGSVASFAMSGAIDLHESAAIDIYRQPALKPGGRFSVELAVSRLYQLGDFDLAAGAVTVDLGPIILGGGSTQLTGSGYYWERSYLLACSVALTNHARVGCSGNYQLLQYSGGYNDIGYLSLTAGLLLLPSESLRIAAAIANLNRPRYFDGGGNPPLAGTISVSYCFSPTLSFFTGYRFESSLPDRLSLGQRVQLSRNFVLWLGLRTDPLDFSGGVSITLGKFCFDYGYSDNVYLGGTHRIGLRYTR